MTTTTFNKFKIGPAVPIMVVGGHYMLAAYGTVSIPTIGQAALTAFTF